MESLMVSIKENWCQKWCPHNIHKSSGKQVLRAQTYQVEVVNLIKHQILVIKFSIELQASQ